MPCNWVLAVVYDALSACAISAGIEMKNIPAQEGHLVVIGLTIIVISAYVFMNVFQFHLETNILRVEMKVN